MAVARHDPAVLAQFQDGERCLVWARRKDDGSLFKLEDGTARYLKPWAKEHLECFMPDCGDRHLTTVARHPRRRDGFRHNAGAGGHSAESEAHQQGKAALVAWVEQTLGPSGVTAVAEQSTSDRKRVADVMVTWPDGRQVALEVQYAPLSVEHWQRRHDSYREQGIVDVWLLGHASKHLRQGRKYAWEDEGAADDMVALGDLHQAMAEAGVPVLWINPVLAAVGTASVERRPHVGRSRPYGDGHDDATFQVPPGPQEVRGAFLGEDLAGCTLTPDGLVTPSLAALRAAAEAADAVDAARKAADAAEAAAAAEQARLGTARERRDAEERDRWVQEQRCAQQAAWDASELRQRLLALHNGTVPTLISVVLGNEGGVYAPAEHWRTAIYRHLIWNKKGSSFTPKAAYAAIYKEGIALNRSSPRPRARAINGWLVYLERSGYLDIERSPDEARTIVKITVLGDLDNPPPPRTPPAPRPAQPAPIPAPPKPDRSPKQSITPGRELRRLIEAQRAATRAAPTVDRPGADPAETEALTLLAEAFGARVVTTPANAAGPPPGPARCRRCGDPLDPALTDIGLHVLC